MKAIKTHKTAYHLNNNIINEKNLGFQKKWRLEFTIFDSAFNAPELYSLLANQD